MDKAFWHHFSTYCDNQGDEFTRFVVVQIQDEFLGRPIDEIGYKSRLFVEGLKNELGLEKWAHFYDLAQFLADFSSISAGGEPYSQVKMHGEGFIEIANTVLEKEKSAYRFVSGELIGITSDEEIAEIEQATALGNPFDSSCTHIKTALAMYGNRDHPDYRNSIKESISAIESALRVINGEKSKSLPAALEKAEKRGFVLFPALREGIKKIYGWTSDESGIRHSLEGSKANVGEAEAKLMIVMCSALLNYITIKSNESSK